MIAHVELGAAQRRVGLGAVELAQRLDGVGVLAVQQQPGVVHPEPGEVAAVLAPRRAARWRGR